MLENKSNYRFLFACLFVCFCATQNTLEYLTLLQLEQKHGRLAATRYAAAQAVKSEHVCRIDLHCDTGPEVSARVNRRAKKKTKQKVHNLQLCVMIVVTPVPAQWQGFGCNDSLLISKLLLDLSCVRVCACACTGLACC